MGLRHWDKIMVNSDDVVAAVEMVFSNCRQVLVGRIRTELIDQNKEYESMDLDYALEHCIKAWQEMSSRFDNRLEALFSMADTDGDGNLSVTEFHDVSFSPCLMFDLDV